MDINKYFSNDVELNKKYNFFISKNQLIKKEGGKNLVLSHIKKAEHNLKFLETIEDEFIDWKIVVLYYSLYHSCLALVKNKN